MIPWTFQKLNLLLIFTFYYKYLKYKNNFNLGIKTVLYLKYNCTNSLFRLHSCFPLIWFATWPCSEKVEFWTFDPNPRVRGKGVCRQTFCDHVAAYVIPFNLICNMTLFWKSWILTFWPVASGGGGGAKYWVPCCYISWFHLIWYATWPCSEIVEFLPIDPIP